jgi:hypothetical protein
LENASKWQSGVTKSQVISSGAIRVGTQFKEVIKVIGRPVETICEIIEFEPGKQVGFRSNSSAAIQFEGRYTFEPTQSGTRLTYSGWTRLGGFWRLVEPFFGGEVKKELEAELKRVKALLEAMS